MIYFYLPPSELFLQLRSSKGVLKECLCTTMRKYTQISFHDPSNSSWFLYSSKAADILWEGNCWWFLKAATSKRSNSFNTEQIEVFLQNKKMFVLSVNLGISLIRFLTLRYYWVGPQWNLSLKGWNLPNNLHYYTIRC